MHKLSDIGVVIKIEENEAIVMTDGSVFKRVKRKPDMFPGQKILLKREDLINYKKSKIKYYYSGLAGLAAALLFIFVNSYFINFNANLTYAYVNVDINPSLELEINNKEVVKGVKPLNNDAEKLIEDIKVKDMNIRQALIRIIDKSLEKGYIQKEKEQKYILIAAALDKSFDKSEQKSLKQQKKLDDYLKNLETYLVESYGKIIRPKVVSVPSDYHEKSIEYNISMGKYLIYSEAKKLGKIISIYELKSEDLTSLIRMVDLDTTSNNEPNADTSSIATPTPVAVGSNTPLSLKTVTPTTRATIGNYPKVSSPTVNPVTSASVIATPSAIVTSSAIATISLPILCQKDENALVKGLKGEYYDNSDFTSLKMARIDPEVNFRWGEDSPDPSIDKDTFSVRWTGVIIPRYTEKYTFSTCADDGVRLWINNTLIIDNWKSQSEVTTKGILDMVGGSKYDIRIEFLENVKSCMIELCWESKSQKNEIIPSCQLYHYADAYQAERAVFSRGDTETTNKGYSGNSYVNYINEVGSYIEWTVNINKAGTYTLNFGYANGTSVNRPLEIMINNNIIAKSMDFNSTSTWTNWKSRGITVNLNSGVNVIRATAVTSNGGPNIDYLEVL
jgi:hypothetical protein